MSDIDPRLVRRFRRFSAAGSLFSIATGLFALLGWVFNIAILKTWVPGGGHSIRFNAAICLVLLGLAIVIGIAEKPRPFAQRAVRIGAGIATCVGWLSVLESLSGWDLRIDQLLLVVRPGEEVGGLRSGLIPLIPALSLGLLGLAVLLLDWRTRRRDWPAQFLAGASLVVASLGMLDFALGQAGSQTNIALPAAVNLLILSLAVVYARPDWAGGGLLVSPAQGAQWLRRTLPAALAALILCFALMSKALLTTVHLAWIEVSCVMITAGLLLVALIGRAAILIEHSDRKRERAEGALHLDATKLDELMDRYDDGSVDRRLRYLAVAGVGLGILLVGIGGLVHWRSLGVASEENRWVTHTYEVQTALEATLEHAVDIGSGARGFAATGEELLLESFLSGERQVHTDLDRLTSLTMDNADQQQRLQQLRSLVDTRLQNAEETIAERKRTGTAPQVAIFLAGKDQMQLVRACVGDMQAEESRLLEKRTQAARAGRQQTEQMVLITTILGMTLLTFAGILTSSAIRQSAKLRGRVQRLNVDLERRVEEGTDRWRAEERRVRILLDSTAEAIIGEDLDGRCMFCNPAAARLLGYDATAELIGGDIHTLIHHSTAEGAPIARENCKFLHAGKAERPYHEEQVVFWRKDGTRLSAECWAYPIRDDRKVVGTVVTFLDISERRRAEHLVRDSEARYRTLVENIFEGFCVIEVLFDDSDNAIDFRYVEISPSFEKQTGLKNACGKRIRELAPSIEDYWIYLYGKVALTGTHAHYENKVAELGRWFEVHAVRVGDPAQRKVAVTFNDVTARRQSEESLRKNRLQLGVALRAARAGDFVWNITTNEVAWGEEEMAVFGVKPEEFRGRYEDWYDRLVPEDRAGAIDVVQHSVHSGELETEFRIRRKDNGEVRWIAARGTVICDESGAPRSMVGINMDVTERKRAEEAIRESEYRLRTLGDNLPEGVIYRYREDPDGQPHIDFISAGIEKLTGIPAAEFLRDSGTVQRSLSPEEAGRLNAAIKLSRDQLTNFEFEMRRKHRRTGELRWFLLRSTPTRHPDGSTVWDGIEIDITARKGAEEQVLRLNKELEQRVQERTADLEAFTYSVSHDLRAPLRHISGFSKILMEECKTSLTREAQHTLQRISEGATRMGQLIDDLLSLSRLGRQSLSPQITKLNSVVQEVIDGLQPDCAGRHVEWRVGELGQAECDAGLIRQVFQNLLSNALKYTRPRSEAMIEIGQQQQNGTSVIYVRDNGVGFSMKYVDKLFGVFQRLHRTEEFEGTGVGLATVLRIIQKHDGRIWAEAELDKGATFFFILGNFHTARSGRLTG